MVALVGTVISGVYIAREKVAKLEDRKGLIMDEIDNKTVCSVDEDLLQGKFSPTGRSACG